MILLATVTILEGRDGTVGTLNTVPGPGAGRSGLIQYPLTETVVVPFGGTVTTTGVGITYPWSLPLDGIIPAGMVTLLA